MLNPVFVFGLVIATLYGLGFHVVMGGPARRMVLFVTTSWVGFLLGQYIGDFISIDFMRIGIVHLMPATVCSFVFLVFAHVITTEKLGRVTQL